jgi:hypothetical protein
MAFIVTKRNSTPFKLDITGYSAVNGGLVTLTLMEKDCNKLIDRLMQELWDKRNTEMEINETEQNIL